MQTEGSMDPGVLPHGEEVTNLPHCFELGKAACQRYVGALADVEAPRQAYQQVHRLTQSYTRHGRSVRGLNPLRRDDALLFEAVCKGEHLIQGFRNRDIVRHMYPNPPGFKCIRQQRSRKITRLLRVLWTHGLIAKVPRSRRWRVTAEARRLMSSTMVLRHVDIPACLAAIHA